MENGSTLEQRVSALETRCKNLEEIILSIRAQAVPQQAAPTTRQPARSEAMKPYYDKVYKIGGHIYQCRSHQDFAIVKKEYAELLAEVKTLFPQDKYEQFVKNANEQVLKIYNEKKKDWPTDYSDIVAGGRVPLGRDCKFDTYFKTTDEAISYLARHAETEQVIADCLPTLCRCFGGLNVEVYTEIAMEMWKREHKK